MGINLEQARRIINGVEAEISVTDVTKPSLTVQQLKDIVVGARYQASTTEHLGHYSVLTAIDAMASACLGQKLPFIENLLGFGRALREELSVHDIPATTVDHPEGWVS